MLPKIELHCHLDGSLRLETVRTWLEAALDDTEEREWIAALIEDEALLRQNLSAPVPCLSLDMYLKCFKIPIMVLQNEAALERAAYELMEDAVQEGVKYIEIRFAPQLHTAHGLSLNAIIGAVLAGIARGERTYDIKGRLILGYLRNTKPEGVYDIIEAGLPFLNKGVVAVDLCGGEHDLFSNRFVEAFAYAREKGYHITVHAGETGILENIIEAIELLKAERIGHGTALMQSAESYALLKDRGVTLECCPTSNLQTKAVNVIEDHPIEAFRKASLAVTLNTDNRTVSQTTMSREWELVTNAFTWDETVSRAVTEAAIDAIFAEDAVKDWLRNML
jgi:adenosine deaminase